MTDFEARHLLARALHFFFPPSRKQVDAPHGVNLPGETDPC